MLNASLSSEFKRSRIQVVAAVVAVVFGLATIYSGASVLFGSEQAQRAAGHVVQFVLWFNFLTGFVYVTAGVGLWRARRWGFWLSAGLTLALAIVFALFMEHVDAGGLFEMRTLYALVFRFTVWCLITIVAYRVARRRNKAC